MTSENTKTAREEYVFPLMYLVARIVDPFCRLLDKLAKRASAS